MTPAEILRAARARIAQGWTQQAYARDKYGEPEAAKDPDACAWCAIGAAFAEVVATEWIAALEFLEAVTWPNVADWNDAPERTQAEVLDAFDRAIALAEGEDK